MARSTKVSERNRERYISLGLNIAYWRKKSGLTQDQLSEKVGISRSYLGKIEAPNIITTMSLEVIFNISNALGISPSKLFESGE